MVERRQTGLRRSTRKEIHYQSKRDEREKRKKKERSDKEKALQQRSNEDYQLQLQLIHEAAVDQAIELLTPLAYIVTITRASQVDDPKLLDSVDLILQLQGRLIESVYLYVVASFDELKNFQDKVTAQLPAEDKIYIKWMWQQHLILLKVVNINDEATISYFERQLLLIEEYHSRTKATRL